MPALLAGRRALDFDPPRHLEPADLPARTMSTLAEAAFAEAEAKGAFAFPGEAHVASPASTVSGRDRRGHGGGGRVVVITSLAPSVCRRCAAAMPMSSLSRITAPPRVLAGRLAARPRILERRAGAAGHNAALARGGHYTSSTTAGRAEAPPTSASSPSCAPPSTRHRGGADSRYAMRSMWLSQT